MKLTTLFLFALTASSPIVAEDYHVSIDGDNDRAIVTSEILGTTIISQLPFVQADGSAYEIDSDYFGKARDKNQPTPGLFASTKSGEFYLKVWPKD